MSTSSIDAERRAKYIEYVCEARPYEEILDAKMADFR